MKRTGLQIIPRTDFPNTDIKNSGASSTLKHVIASHFVDESQIRLIVSDFVVEAVCDWPRLTYCPVVGTSPNQCRYPPFNS